MSQLVRIYFNVTLLSSVQLLPDRTRFGKGHGKNKQTNDKQTNKKT